MKRNFFLLVISTFCITGSAFAQVAVIQGNVRDTSATPISNAAVLVNLEGKAVGATITDDEGNYRIEGVVPGIYDLVIKTPKTCYVTVTHPGVVLEEDKVKTVDFTVECYVSPKHGRGWDPTEINRNNAKMQGASSDSKSSEDKKR